MQAIDRLKSEGKYREAGAMAYEHNKGREYGCHFGMRSTRSYAISEYQAGYDEAKWIDQAPLSHIKV